MGRRAKSELQWFRTRQGFAGPEVSARAGEVFQAVPSQVRNIKGVEPADAPVFPAEQSTPEPDGFEAEVAAMLAEAATETVGDGLPVEGLDDGAGSDTTAD